MISIKLVKRGTLTTAPESASTSRPTDQDACHPDVTKTGVLSSDLPRTANRLVHLTCEKPPNILLE
jgi:hypothetical protein